MAWVAGGTLILVSILIVVEAVLRKVLSISLGGVDEITAYAFAVTTAWALPYALMERANVRIDAFHTLGPLPVRVILEAFALFVMTVFFGYLLFRGGEHALGSLIADRRSNSSFQAPLVIPQGLWVFGLAVQLVCLLALCVRMARAIGARRYVDAASVLAPPDEIHRAKDRVQAAGIGGQTTASETERAA